jgi:hypothetical protein
VSAELKVARVSFAPNAACTVSHGYARSNSLNYARLKFCKAGDIMQAQRLARIFIPALITLALTGSAQSRYEYPRHDEHIEFACPPEDRPVPRWARPRPMHEGERGALNADSLLVALLTGILGFALGRVTR